MTSFKTHPDFIDSARKERYSNGKCHKNPWNRSFGYCYSYEQALCFGTEGACPHCKEVLG
jgi:hypothetical protein